MALQRTMCIVFSGFLTLMLLATGVAETSKDPIQNELGMKFVLIDPGLFTMGSPANERYRDAGETQHKVTLTKAFYLQTTEVTVAQWQQVMGKSMLRKYSRNQKMDNLPITRVGWHDAQSFIKRLNARGGANYRLPTEAEW